MSFDAGPAHDCPDCPRLASFRAANRAAYPDWWNAPVPSFGEADARLIVVGLAPGLRGANRTGRPFTGDFAGDLLYGTLTEFGFARGAYAARPDDGLTLVDCRIANAVHCVPPENKPTPAEIKTCRYFLASELSGLPRLRAVVALGRIAHDSIVIALGGRSLYDSYHCSRYNTNTGRLTPEMFRAVFAAIRAELGNGE